MTDEQIVPLVEHQHRVLKALVDKLEAAFASDSYKALLAFAYIHGGRYDGPNVEEELKAAKVVLIRWEGEEGD